MYTLEYSSNQKAFHIDDLESIILGNVKKYFSNIPTDWELLGVFDSYEKANHFREYIEKEKLNISTKLNPSRKELSYE